MEIWGWSQRDVLERIQTEYYRWILRLYFCTHRYTIFRETDTVRIRVDWALRAVKFEDRIFRQDVLTAKCLLEKQSDGNKDLYGAEKKGFSNSIGLREWIQRVCKVYGV